MQLMRFAMRMILAQMEDTFTIALPKMEHRVQ